MDYSLLRDVSASSLLLVGNLGKIPAVEQWISSLLQGHELWVSAAVSQVISNVPAALMLSGFTEDWKGLLLGTNIGGLGTLDRVHGQPDFVPPLHPRETGAKTGRYVLVFTGYNVLFLAVLAVFSLIL